MKYILVIDAGTSEFKAVLFDCRMTLSGLSRKEFSVINTGPGRVEIDTETYWRICVEAIREAIRESSVDPVDIAAVAVTSHTDTLFILDRSGKALTNGVLWTDSRAASQAEKIQNHFGLENLFRTTGQTGASFIHFASRLSWFMENKTEIMSRARFYLQTQDFILFRLSGNAIQDQSIATSSLLGHLEKKEYWGDMLGFLGIPEEKLSSIASPGDIIGSLTTETAADTGLAPGIPVVAGAMDAIASALAMNNIHEGIVTEVTGSVLVLGATSDEPKFDDKIRVPCFVHAVKGKYLVMPWNETAGMALKWYRDQFFKPFESFLTTRTGSLYDVITAEAAQAPSGSDGVMLLPHFAGSGSPDFNPHAKAVLYGLTTTHTRNHISRAFLESVAFLLKQNLDILVEMGIGIERLISSGGGSKSTLWCQIKADVTGLPVTVSPIPESSAKGAAILAAKAIGEFEENTISSREEFSVYLPDPETQETYSKAYRRFVDLNNHMKPFYDRQS